MGAIVETTLPGRALCPKSFMWKGRKRDRGHACSNKSQEPQHTKCLSFQTHMHPITELNQMIKMELKDTQLYLQVPIHREDQHLELLQFQWNEGIYLSVPVPSIQVNPGNHGFSQRYVMKLVMGTQRYMHMRMGIQPIIYLNISIIHQVKEELIQIIVLICQMFEVLGLVINQKNLSTKMEFLGFLVDAAILAEKLRKIQQLAHNLPH